MSISKRVILLLHSSPKGSVQLFLSSPPNLSQSLKLFHCASGLPLYYQQCLLVLHLCSEHSLYPSALIGSCFLCSPLSTPTALYFSHSPPIAGPENGMGVLLVFLLLPNYSPSNLPKTPNLISSNYSHYPSSLPSSHSFFTVLAPVSHSLKTIPVLILGSFKIHLSNGFLLQLISQFPEHLLSKDLGICPFLPSATHSHSHVL